MTGQPNVSGSRDPLNLEAIVDAAVAVMVDRGVDGLTMRAVAGRLGTAPMSLYRHVRDRDALVGLAVDRSLDPTVLPAVDEDTVPSQWLQRTMAIVRVQLLSVPGSAEHLLLRGPTGPNTMAFMAATCSVLRRTGRNPAETAWAYDWLMTTASAYISKESRIASGERGRDLAGELAGRAHEYVADHPDLLDVVLAFNGDMAAAYTRAVGFVIDALTGGAGRREASDRRGGVPT